MARLLFFCGHAGVGKTTLAKSILQFYIRQNQRYCFLDKDTLYGSYSAKVMEVLTGVANDRDSPVYLEHLRNVEYKGLLEVAREQVGLGVDTIVVGPFSQEVKARLLWDINWLKVSPETIVKVIWVYLSEEEAHRRIALRADSRDEYKLLHWDEYRKRLFMPAHDLYSEIIFYNNSDAQEQSKKELFELLLKKLSA